MVKMIKEKKELTFLSVKVISQGEREREKEINTFQGRKEKKEIDPYLFRALKGGKIEERRREG